MVTYYVFFRNEDGNNYLEWYRDLSLSGVVYTLCRPDAKHFYSRRFAEWIAKTLNERTPGLGHERGPFKIGVRIREG